MSGSTTFLSERMFQHPWEDSSIAPPSPSASDSDSSFCEEEDDSLPLLSNADHCRVFEDETSVQVYLDMPGVSGRDISVQLSGNALHIAGIRKRDRKKRRFETSFCLGPSSSRRVQMDRAVATMNGGVLMLYAPKEREVLADSPPDFEFCSDAAARL